MAKQHQRKFDFRNKERGRAALKAMIEQFDSKEIQATPQPKISIEERRRLLREQAEALKRGGL